MLYFRSVGLDDKIGELAVVLTLEDWGPITQKVTIGDNSQVMYLFRHFA